MSPTSHPSAGKRPVDEASSPLNTKKARLDVGNAADVKDAAEPSLDESNDDDVKKHSGNLYYQDGNIVLIAEKVAFRVHRTYLASRSEVFKNMLELASHPKDGERFDDCPAIHLDDKVDDLITFLEALHGYIAIQDIEHDFTKFSAVLRLSTKYIVDTLRSSCIWHLSLAKLPTTLDTYDKHYHEVETVFRYIKHYYLVYEIDATCLLPTSFYLLSILDPSKIDTYHLHLTVDVMLRLYKGRTTLFENYTKILEQLERKIRARDCSICQKKKEVIIKDMLSKLTRSRRFDPLRYLYRIRENKCDTLCGSCLREIKRQVEEARQEIWDSLPKVFNFGNSWDDLKDDCARSSQNQVE